MSNGLLPRALLALGLGMALLASTPAVARQNTMALACLSSATGDTIYFEYRFGNDEWESLSATPDQWQMLMWNYDRPNVNRSPQLQVRYDDDMSDGENFVVTDVEAYAADAEDCEGQGKTYHFQDRGGELFLVEDDE